MPTIQVKYQEVINAINALNQTIYVINPIIGDGGGPSMLVPPYENHKVDSKKLTLQAMEKLEELIKLL